MGVDLKSHKNVKKLLNDILSISKKVDMHLSCVKSVCDRRWSKCKFLFSSSSRRRVTSFGMLCHSTRRAYLRSLTLLI